MNRYDRNDLLLLNNSDFSKFSMIYSNWMLLMFIYSLKVPFSDVLLFSSLTSNGSPLLKWSPFPSLLNFPLMSLKAFCQHVRQPRFKLWLKFALETTSQLSNVLLCLLSHLKFSSRFHAHRLISCESVYFASIFAAQVRDFFFFFFATAVPVRFFCCLIMSLSLQKLRLTLHWGYFSTQMAVLSLAGRLADVIKNQHITFIVTLSSSDNLS